MPKSVAIVQSNYIPWKGYFDLINMVDEFILLDDVQYTRRDWRNRNRIKTPQGLKWLTIPVEVSGRYYEKIYKICVSDPKWPRRHWDTIRANYAKAACFDEYRDMLEELYLETHETMLSQINFRFLKAFCGLLGITTKLSWSMDYQGEEGKNERILAMCQQAGATKYISGPAAKGYLDENLFAAHGIEVCWMDYSGYPEYPQLHPPFEHGVTILDLILNRGACAPKHMKSFGY